jgi:hypothetical protein
MKTSKANINKEIIALFSGQASILTTPKLYVDLTGKHSLALVLNQCVFWSNKSKLNGGWFYKTYEDWFEEVHMPERSLRRYFDKLEEAGWIITKVKKVNGQNIKHIFTNLDYIIESLSNITNNDCPNQPTCPSGSIPIQNTCTNIAPTGQSGRMEPANLAGSTIYTDENIQNTKTYDPSFRSSSFLSKDLDQKALDQKLPEDRRSDEQFLESCAFHVDHKSDPSLPRLQRSYALIKLLTKKRNEGLLFTTEKDKLPSNVSPIETRKETIEERNARYIKENQSWGNGIRA